MSWRMGDSIRHRRRERTFSAPRGAARWLGFALLIALLAFGTGYAVAALVLFPPPAETDGGIATPSLLGRRVDDAERQLRERGLVLADIIEVPHPERPAGIVIAQSPLAGQHLRAGAGVTLGVSAGPPRARVPDVSGLNADRAAALASMRGFQVDRRTEESDAPAGTVIGIEPEPGTELVVPAPLVLVVSSGPAALPLDSLAPDAPPPDTLAPDTASLVPPRP